MAKARHNTDEVIEPLMNATKETMIKILGNASKKSVPIEVDGIVYYIPKPVSDLVDGLANMAGVETCVKPVKDIMKDDI